jgi:positive regulator of sigma E activity
MRDQLVLKVAWLIILFSISTLVLSYIYNIKWIEVMTGSFILIVGLYGVLYLLKSYSRRHHDIGIYHDYPGITLAHDQIRKVEKPSKQEKKKLR